MSHIDTKDPDKSHRQDSLRHGQRLANTGQHHPQSQYQPRQHTRNRYHRRRQFPPLPRGIPIGLMPSDDGNDAEDKVEDEYSYDGSEDDESGYEDEESDHHNDDEDGKKQVPRLPTLFEVNEDEPEPGVAVSKECRKWEDNEDSESTSPDGDDEGSTPEPPSEDPGSTPSSNDSQTHSLDHDREFERRQSRTYTYIRHLTLDSHSPQFHSTHHSSNYSSTDHPEGKLHVTEQLTRTVVISSTDPGAIDWDDIHARVAAPRVPEGPVWRLVG